MTQALRVLRVPHSTNVDRVALAAGHKGVEIDWADVDPDDRSAVVALSGQPLVPVMALGDGEVIAGSMDIVRRLEDLAPRPALWPADRSARAQTDIFLAWFDRVWKVAPNAIDAERATPSPDAGAIGAWTAEIVQTLPLFEALLEGRSFLLGEELGAADVSAFPFLVHGVTPPAPGDDDPFHAILSETLPITSDRFPRLKDWVARIAALPRA